MSKQTELKMGIKAEKEHKGTIKYIMSKCHSGKCPTYDQIYAKIAKNHLDEDPKYYSKLKKAKL
jgi:peptidyl-tRNA hydrolase